MKARSLYLRKSVDLLVRTLAVLATSLGACLLGWLFFDLVWQGAPSLNRAFFSQLPLPPGQVGGGILNALQGSVWMTLLALAVAAPIGILAGVYLVEFDRDSSFARLVRVSIRLINGFPPILLGLFVFLVVVVPTGQYSGYAGSLALGMLLAPLIAEVTEKSLLIIPLALREASLSLGASRWRTVRVLLSRSTGLTLLRGILRASARVCGMTSPLLFSALNSPFRVENLSEPTANLMVTIFQYGLSPYPERNQIAWGISLLIVIVLLIVKIGTSMSHKENVYE